MRFKRVLPLLMGLGLFFSFMTTTASASKQYLNAFPSPMQAKWYAYNKKTGYTTLKISDHQLSVIKDQRTTATVSLHAYQKHDATKATKKQANWIYAWRDNDWIATYGWNQRFGSGSYFNVKKVKKSNQLTIHSMQAGVNSGTYYQTKHLAKHYGSKQQSNNTILM
ncbi:hypothetical protein [Nicoliella lavandulae]|uniref:Uncharacterized protein n=1 Tax=Nicoliella lavandulae TaxID=3082954 RepID=A0ABU8SMF3_9LACO